MTHPILKTAIRTMFTFRSREKAMAQSRILRDKYAGLARGMSGEAGQLRVKVPPMPGVDEDMWDWSFFMILAHNTIVNRGITEIVTQLSRGETPSGAAEMDMKKDVMPSPDADEAQLDLFADSVTRHLEAVGSLGRLRGTQTLTHPVFGDFDAHKWHCMFAFHLGLHYPQAKFVADKARSEKPGDSG